MKQKSEHQNTPKLELPVLSFSTQTDFEQWLSQNYDLQTGIWLRFYKKNSGVNTIVYDQALNVALCFGWIDGQLKKYDELSYIQKFTHRRKRSLWSKRNINKAEMLIKEGKMQAPGMAEFNRAIADGRYEKAYESAEDMVIPDDFLSELAKNVEAQKFYQTLDKTNMYTIYWRLQTASNDSIRSKRMKVIIEKLSKNEKFH